jgi:hypothetical protein
VLTVDTQRTPEATLYVGSLERGASLQLTAPGAHRHPFWSSPYRCHGQTSRSGLAAFACGGLLRTLSVPGRDFTRPAPQAHGHIDDMHRAGLS